MITFLSLIVAILAVFFGPLVAWAVARQQIAVTARETWMRDLRDKVAAFLSAHQAYLLHIASHTTGDPVKEKRLADIHDAESPPFYAIRLLIAEKGPEYISLVQVMDRLVRATTEQTGPCRDELMTTAEDILRRERAAIAADPGVWGALLTALRLGAGPSR